MTLKNNIVLGTGGHSRVILENLYILNKKNIKIYDFNFSIKKNNTILKNKVHDLKKMSIKKYFNKFKAKIKMPNLISKNSSISRYSKLGKANFFNNFCFIGPNSKIGNNNIINTKSLIEHDVKIGSHCHIGPSVKIGGGTSIGDNVMCGIGSIIINKINICSNVTIGAGSIITKSIRKPGTYVTFKNKLTKL